MEKIFNVEGMRCEHCSQRVEKALTALGYDVLVDLSKGEVKVSKDFIDEGLVKNEIEDLGFIVKA